LETFFRRGSWWGMALLLGAGLTFTACDDDDDDDNGTPPDGDTPAGTFAVSNQFLSESGGVITVNSVDVDQDSWLVVYRDNGSNGPDFNSVISEPEFIAEDASGDIDLSLAEAEEVEYGEQVWVVLHNESGDGQDFTYDGTTESDDQPIATSGGQNVAFAFTNQFPDEGTMTAYTLDEVNGSGVSGTATLYSGADAATYVLLEMEGTTDGNTHPAHIHEGLSGSGGGIVVTLDSVNGGTGMSLTRVTNFDASYQEGAAVTYEELLEFPGHINVHLSPADLSVVASGNIGYNSTEGASGSFAVADTQAFVTNGNTILVDSLDITRGGWVVVHRNNDNGTPDDTSDDAPVVPDIISEPLFVSDTTEAPLNLSLAVGQDVAEGEVVWIMLHYDTGTAGTYEFDGVNGLDLPVLDEEGNIVMAQTTINLN
jgi:hypothetical protein